MVTHKGGYFNDNLKIFEYNHLRVAVWVWPGIQSFSKRRFRGDRNNFRAAGNHNQKTFLPTLHADGEVGG